MKRPNFGQRGFTLVELVFVIAIIVILASIFLPLAISKLKKADDAVADASIQEIAAALASFYDDIRHFPTCSSVVDCSPMSSTNNDLRFLAFGDGFGDLSASYPTNATGTDFWNLATSGQSVGLSHAMNNGANHLVVNDPNVSGGATATDYESATTKDNRWRGPYLSRVTFDPWGRTYIAYVGAMEKNGTTLSAATAGIQKGWILSGGSDKSLDTRPTDTSLVDDDRGFIFHTE